MTKDIVLSDDDRHYLKTYIEEELKPKLHLLTELEILVVEEYALIFYTLAFIQFYASLRYDLSLLLLDDSSTNDAEVDQNYFNNFFENYVKQEVKKNNISILLSFIVRVCGFDCYKLGISRCKTNLKNHIAEVVSES